MSTHTHSLSGWRPTRRAVAFIAVAVLAAVAVVVTVLLLTSTTSQNTQPIAPAVDTVHPPSPGHSVVYDCRPTRVIHAC